MNTTKSKRPIENGDASAGEPQRNELSSRVQTRLNGDGAPSAATAQAVVAKLGLTERECKALLDARDVPPAVLNGLAKVSLPDIAQAFPPDEVEALCDPDSGIRLKPQQKLQLPEVAERVSVAASVVTKLGASSLVVEHAARKDADLLDAVTHAVVPQLNAQAAVDDAVAERHAPMFGYWKRRFPGGPKGPRTAKPNGATVPVK